jgi:hypothetical protein
MNFEASTQLTLNSSSQAEMQVDDLSINQIPLEELQLPKYAADTLSSDASEIATRPVTPSYADVDKFLADVSISWSLSKSDLDKIIQDAWKPSDSNKSSVATFLRDNFDDICHLSANGGDKLSYQDLTLYSEILKHSKKNIAEGKPPESGLHDVYSSHENKEGGLLPGIGLIGGVYAGDKVFKTALAATLPATLRALKSNPRTGFLALVGTQVASWLGGGYAGATVGGIVDRAIQDGPVQRHYIDEAAPAMKRLMEKQFPTKETDLR